MVQDKKADKNDKRDKKDRKSVIDKKAVTADAKVEKSTQKKKNEIDELFASKPKPLSTDEDLKSTQKKTVIAPPADDDDDGDDWTDSKGKRKKRRPTTEEGYPIFSVQEMKIGLGGDTPECPFDCQCCY